MYAAADLISLGRSLDLMHGLAMHRVFPFLAERLHGGELSFSQFNALYQLCHDGPQTIAGLAQATHLSHNAASRMVDGLVVAGFAERHEDPGDRRQKKVELTRAGEQRLGEMQDFTIRTYADLLSAVPAEVLDQLSAALDVLKPYLPNYPIEAGRDASSSTIAQKAAGTRAKRSRPETGRSRE
ncbi:MarR family winged helix-turn-helix transcriptional regulator [Burkholderia gladioli]|uniref:MarR family winged helix-turn-helix transcriptional regulator n=1 Tax=Burkholderia gladioli TaxID=28095 RepID=UPI00163F6ED5|nr:MarR family transcriptional regulator [Burkholderia gladioli]